MRREREREKKISLFIFFQSIFSFTISTNEIWVCCRRCERIKTRLFDRYHSHTICTIKIWSTCLIPTWGVNTSVTVVIVNLVNPPLFRFSGIFWNSNVISFPHPIAKRNVSSLYIQCVQINKVWFKNHGQTCIHYTCWLHKSFYVYTRASLQCIWTIGGGV